MTSYSYLWHLTIFTLFHSSFSNQNSSTRIQCIEYEKTALLEFKNDLIDAANRLVSWNASNDDCCKWYGVTCNNVTGHVTKVRLRGPDAMSDFSFNDQEADLLRFRGEINPSLQNLTSLEYLDLSCNDFRGNPIPKFISSLRNLTYLNLSESRFSGEFPNQLEDLSKLRVLSIRSLYSGDHYVQQVTSLRWLSGLSFLRHLDMSGVQFGDVFDWSWVTGILLPRTLEQLHLSDCGLPPIPPCLTMVTLTSLSILDLSYNNFSTNSIPSWITSLQSLVSLNLAHCDLNGLVPAGIINNMNSLAILDLSNNQITGIQATRDSDTKTICNLKEINLSWNKFDGKSLLDILTSLFECESSKLESLRFASNRLSGNLPPQLGNLKNLVHIDLNKNSISGPIPDSLGNLSSLQTLELGSNLISGPIPGSIGRLSSLLWMYLPSNLITGPLPDSLGGLSALKGLDLSYNEINGTLPQSIGDMKLESCDLSYNKFTERIPSSTQLQSCEESSFVGNQLCGLPVGLRCGRQGGEGAAGDGGGAGGGSGDSDWPDWGLIISIVVGFVVGFWVVVAPLVSSKLWRTKYYKFMDDVWCKCCGS